MQAELTHEEWEDSQRHEAGFWARQVADGNMEQRRRDDWYRRVCFPQWFAGRSFAGLWLCDLGSGPAGILTSVPDAAMRMQVDPLFPSFRAAGFRDAPGVANHTAQAEDTMLDGGAWDVVFCLNCLDHTRDPAAVIREAGRLLRPGGALVLCVDLRPESALDKYHKLRITEPHVRAWIEAAGLGEASYALVPHQPGNPAIQLCVVAARA